MSVAKLQKASRLRKKRRTPPRAPRCRVRHWCSGSRAAARLPRPAPCQWWSPARHGLEQSLGHVDVASATFNPPRTVCLCALVGQVSGVKSLWQPCEQCLYSARVRSLKARSSRLLGPKSCGNHSARNAALACAIRKHRRMQSHAVRQQGQPVEQPLELLLIKARAAADDATRAPSPAPWLSAAARTGRSRAAARLAGGARGRLAAALRFFHHLLLASAGEAGQREEWSRT